MNFFFLALVNKINLNDYQTIIKLDIEGGETKALEGGFNLIKKASPLIIIEFSKFIFNDQSKVAFLINLAYCIGVLAKFKIKRPKVLLC